LARCPGPDWFEDAKNPSLGRINTHEPLSSGNTNDAALHQEVGYCKTHRRGPCPRSPNLEAAREQQSRKKPRHAIALRRFQRAPWTGKLLAYYSNGPSWKTQLPAILPHSGRGLPGPFHMRYSLGTIHGNQIQETIVPVRVLGREGSRRFLSDDSGVVFPRVPSDAGYPIGTGV
jgi:hypothetical protein